MRLLYCCLAQPYFPANGYQEPALVGVNLEDGHEVVVVASPIELDGGNFVRTEPCDTVLPRGERLIRIDYPKGLPNGPVGLGAKLRIYPAFKKLLREIDPDVIFFHGAQSAEIVTAARYAKKHPDVGLLVDTHASFLNSAKGFISKRILHGIYYRLCYNLAYREIDRLYCTTPNEYEFARKMLRNDTSKMRYLPLGGSLLTKEERERIRREERAARGFSESDIVMLHSGKLAAAKKTQLLLDAMRENPDPRLRLVIAGAAAAPELEKELQRSLAEDSRVICTGWINAEELQRLMCAADIYMQPGSNSCSLQSAMCCGTGAMIRRLGNYAKMFEDGNGVVFFDEDSEVSGVVARLCSGELDTEQLAQKAWIYARDTLDYGMQCRRLVYPFARGYEGEPAE